MIMIVIARYLMQLTKDFFTQFTIYSHQSIFFIMLKYKGVLDLCNSCRNVSFSSLTQALFWLSHLEVVTKQIVPASFTEWFQDWPATVMQVSVGSSLHWISFVCVCARANHFTAATRHLHLSIRRISGDTAVINMKFTHVRTWIFPQFCYSWVCTSVVLKVFCLLSLLFGVCVCACVIILSSKSLITLSITNETSG